MYIFVTALVVSSKRSCKDIKKSDSTLLTIGFVIQEKNDPNPS